MKKEKLNAAAKKAVEDLTHLSKILNEEIQKPRKQVFSFRAEVNDIACWKAYATATGQTMESVGNAAMTEFLKNHPLSGSQKIIFDELEKGIICNAPEENRESEKSD